MPARGDARASCKARGIMNYSGACLNKNRGFPDGIDTNTLLFIMIFSRVNPFKANFRCHGKRDEKSLAILLVESHYP
jgi:hypothetical protein